MHRAAAAPRAPVLAAEELRHHGVRVGTPRQRLAVLAVGGEQVIALAHRVDRAHDRRLLADAQVEEAADLRLGVHLAGALLEAADEHHLLEDRPAPVGVRERVLRA